jgi:Fic-DOC domain mobile mystery protein B
MTDEHSTGFSLRSIGREPTGATPLEEEDLEGLIPDFVINRSDLNKVEFDNIANALPWALRQARILGPEGLLEHGFLLKLHRQMFCDVWKWAGTQRRRVTNHGSMPEEIAGEIRNTFDDMIFWHANQKFSCDERAVRLHNRLVGTHPFPNGNGRCTRLIADLYLVSVGEEMFTWGSQSLDVDGASREHYISALLKARYKDNWNDLVAFARS